MDDVGTLLNWLKLLRCFRITQPRRTATSKLPRFNLVAIRLPSRSNALAFLCGFLSRGRHLDDRNDELLGVVVFRAVNLHVVQRYDGDTAVDQFKGQLKGDAGWLPADAVESFDNKVRARFDVPVSDRLDKLSQCAVFNVRASKR